MSVVRDLQDTPVETPEGATAPKNRLHDGAGLEDFAVLLPPERQDPDRHEGIDDDIREILNGTLQYDKDTRWGLYEIRESRAYKRGELLHNLRRQGAVDLVNASQERSKAAYRRLKTVKVST
jgi:hypothetical protein